MGYKRLRETAVTNDRIIAFRDALPSPANPYQLRKLKKLRASIAYALERMPFGASACERWERNREALAVTIAKGVDNAAGQQRPRSRR